MVDTRAILVFMACSFSACSRSQLYIVCLPRYVIRYGKAYELAATEVNCFKTFDQSWNCSSCRPVLAVAAGDGSYSCSSPGHAMLEFA